MLCLWMWRNHVVRQTLPWAIYPQYCLSGNISGVVELRWLFQDWHIHFEYYVYNVENAIWPGKSWYKQMKHCKTYLSRLPDSPLETHKSRVDSRKFSRAKMTKSCKFRHTFTSTFPSKIDLTPTLIETMLTQHHMLSNILVVLSGCLSFAGTEIGIKGSVGDHLRST